jgi:ABC-2 type transport system ATP-binding protein
MSIWSAPIIPDSALVSCPPSLDRESREPVVVVEGLCKRYQSGRTTTSGIRNLSFSLHSGESLALLGKNGAGKSTTIRVLATLLAADGGVASVAGLDLLSHPSAVRPLLGVALQETSLPRRQTASRLLRYHARLHGLPSSDIDDIVSRLLEELNLVHLSRRLISTYSGGERRRLDLALALIHRPRVVLLDEPTAGLDSLSRAAIWRLLRLQLRAGAAVLFTTHDLAEADAHASRVIVIHDGVVVIDRAPHELKRQFASRKLRIRFQTHEDATLATGVTPSARLTDSRYVTIPVETDGDILPLLTRIAQTGARGEALTILDPTLDSVVTSLIDDDPR